MIPFIGPVIGVFGKVLDKVLPDKMSDLEKAEIMAKMEVAAQQADWSIIQRQADVIMSEATGESFLQRNWRPIVMLWFAGLVGAHWLGFTPENLSEDQVGNLMEIVKIGIGGYVVGRSAEKVAKAWKK